MLYSKNTHYLESSKLTSPPEALVLISKLGGSKAGGLKSCTLSLEVCGFVSELTSKLPFSVNVEQVF